MTEDHREWVEEIRSREADGIVSRWKVMSPDLREHPNYPYIDVVKASDYDELKTSQNYEAALLEQAELDLKRARAQVTELEYIINNPPGMQVAIGWDVTHHQMRLRISQLEAALRYIREEAYGQFYPLDGEPQALEACCDSALAGSPADAGDFVRIMPMTIYPRPMCSGDLCDGLSFDELAACFASPSGSDQ